MLCVEIQFMLLFYKTGRLRVVISTANLVEFDWRDIENTAWVQDVPKREKPISHDPRATDFPAVFERVLNALNVGAGLSSLVRNEFPNLPFPAAHPGALRTRYDFSRVKARLIVSIVGKHESWPSVLGVGHMALMKAVREIGAESKKSNPVTIECQGSSVGTYSTQWMNEFYGSAEGESPEKWLDEPKSRRAKLPWPRVKILFPTLQYVRASVAGEAGGGTIFCRRKQWEATKFPRELFYESRSKRGRILMHTKMIIATLEKPNIVEADGSASSSPETSDTETEPESDDDLVITGDLKGKGKLKKVYGWAYVGSHNFTPSAWGTLSGSGFSPVLNISNYEIGIVLPLHSAAEVDKVACFERPPRKYGKGDLPWMQEESAICQGED
ncbi:hypothetical protein EWM64_g8867 [Hericium alpestre]|uniref:PLD phosphodiesterase domain-containing protein n=1 Tax=Hericium alpestre TaxID=135208 RepID=A0A4Y9ZKM4_9AGAM|nr:hypothetical protein EWM64_g8867 [Hericium alpestre]